MSIDRIVHTAAGGMLLGSLALARFGHPNWIWVAVFVAANLLQSGLSNWCLLSRLLAMAGVQGRGACGLPRG